MRSKSSGGVCFWLKKEDLALIKEDLACTFQTICCKKKEKEDLA
jgi:hypothetical protein